jgi:hypothetical protein
LQQCWHCCRSLREFTDAVDATQPDKLALHPTTVAVWLFLFWPFLIGQYFGYRDTALLYYPLFEWIKTSGARANSALNPLDDFGQRSSPRYASVFYR